MVDSPLLHVPLYWSDNKFLVQCSASHHLYCAALVTHLSDLLSLELKTDKTDTAPVHERQCKPQPVSTRIGVVHLTGTGSTVTMAAGQGVEDYVSTVTAGARSLFPLRVSCGNVDLACVLRCQSFMTQGTALVGQLYAVLRV